MAILSTDITIPVLCPIQFAEPADTEFYPYQQHYVGKLNTDTDFMMLIPPAWGADGTAIYLKAYNVKGALVTSYTLTKATNGAFHYAHTEIIISDFNDAQIVQFNLLRGSTSLATSVYYETFPKYTKHLKRIAFTNSANDWNVVFTGRTFRVTIECGFNPNDYAAKSSKQDFQDQSWTNQTIYAQPYDTEVLSIGGNQGIPNWLYKKLNAILMCDTISILDGASYINYELAQGAELEKIDQTYDGLARYKVELQRTNTFAQ